MILMNYKRFGWKTEKLQHSDDEVIMVVDNANKEWKGHILNIVDLMNELNDERMMYITTIDKRIVELEEENEKLKKKLECCEYEHFLNELNEIHEKVDKGDLSDFSPLKEDKPLNDYNPLKERLYYWQCKYYRRDYEHKMDMCARCNYGGLLNYCLKDKCDKMVKKDYEVTITEFENGMSISWKKEADKR